MPIRSSDLTLSAPYYSPTTAVRLTPSFENICQTGSVSDNELRSFTKLALGILNNNLNIHYNLFNLFKYILKLNNKMVPN